MTKDILVGAFIKQQYEKALLNELQKIMNEKYLNDIDISILPPHNNYFYY